MKDNLNQKGFVNIIFIIGIVILIGAAGYFAASQRAFSPTPIPSPIPVQTPIPIPTPTVSIPLSSPTPTSSSSPVSVACTQEVKQCPDGSYVSRTGKNCEFTKCPALTDSDTPPLKLKTIGVNLDYYNPTTDHAGDFVFTQAKISLGLLIFPFGQVIPGNDTSNYKDKIDPQIEFRLPMGTKVHSLVDGVVTSVPKLYSDDYSIMVSDGVQTNWLYETEHVINPLVKVGDHVIAGQVIAEVSPHSKENYDGLGVVELGILHGGNPPHHVCPFQYLDDSIKSATLSKILAFFKSWENYRGDASLYDEASMQIPGCLSLNPIEG